jgi:hypothetical protein
MEADWAADVGAELPAIEADWEGFVDLRKEPAGIASISEAGAYPALQDTLASLNGPDAAVFTCKCDVWALTAEEIDPMEFGCAAGDACAGMASWIDVLAREPEMFASFERHEAWVRRVTDRLRGLPVGRGRAELVIRSAVYEGRAGFGVTLYAAGCGADTVAAQAAWAMLLRAAATVTMREAAPPSAPPAGE